MGIKETFTLCVFSVVLVLRDCPADDMTVQCIHIAINCNAIYALVSNIDRLYQSKVFTSLSCTK